MIFRRAVQQTPLLILMINRKAEFLETRDLHNAIWPIIK